MTATAAADPRQARVLARLRELVLLGRNVNGSSTTTEQLLQRFADFDSRGRRLLRDEFPDRVAHDRFNTEAGLRLVAGTVAAKDVARTVLDDVEDKVNTLEHLMTQLERPATAATTAGPPAQMPDAARTGPVRVFIVQGQNDAVKTSVQLFLTRALPGDRGDIRVLHEQPNRGSSTVIEKLERYAKDVDFAIVLLTGDDEVTLSTGVQERRARQNVLIELGYFISLLGRTHVVALRGPGTSIPSDISGVIYITYEGPSWKSDLLKELAAAGYEVDWAGALK